MAEDIKQEHVPEHMANDNMPTSGNRKRKEKKERFIIQAIILAMLARKSYHGLKA